ncbi:ABC transporter permease [Nesterenkonia xinjiangensis]|uniref:Osmoprotectant transport system permease protein n=1 Tax=Nesterenkonia xinjiangensis TaxID=225327 RepID=A0A7Z0K9N5_9MICC|nr:ABC transporter permease subunit [Nesterenkonia xinjiangensis]NYJ78891.1 osmoprotectant transport system permease protein [Nesterenkonia xinjiangensis]
MEWILANLPRILGLTADHLLLSLPAVAAAFLISLPVGRLADRLGRLREPLLGSVGLLYAIPSLPLFIVLPILIGTGVRDSLNVIVALTLFGLALMARSSADAFAAVSEDVRLAATAVGHSRWGGFLTVELPLAGPALLAGLRVVSVSTISMVSVSAVLGVTSLGSLFTDGFQRGIVPSIVAGIVMTVLLAVVVDLLLVALGRWIMPWQRPRIRAGAA